MKWLKKLLGIQTATPTTAPADAGAKAFDAMATTLSTPPAPEPKVETVTVVAEPAPEVQAVAAKVEEVVVEAKPKAPRKPRAKKEPVKKETGWPFPGNVPAEGTAKPAVRTVKAK
jgi:hypothetical protein